MYAFLDIHPIQLGHVLVVPKEEIGDILDMSDESLSFMILTAKNIIAPALKKATQCERVGFSVEGLGVKDHMHLHLIPLCHIGDFNPEKAHEETPENMDMICKKIVSFLS